MSFFTVVYFFKHFIKLNLETLKQSFGELILMTNILKKGLKLDELFETQAEIHLKYLIRVIFEED